MALNFGRALMGAHATAERQKLGKEREAWAKKQADYQKKATKKAQGKSLWSSIGGKIGSLGGGALGSMFLTAALAPIAGPAAPALAAAIGGGLGSYAGRKTGERGYGAQGSGTLAKPDFGLDPSDVKKMELSKGRFHSGARTGLEDTMGRGVTDIKEGMSEADRILHQGQLTGALTDAATAGAMAGGSDWMGDLFGDASSKYMQADILGNKDLVGNFDITDIIRAQGT